LRRSRAASRSNSTRQMRDWFTASTCLAEFALQIFECYALRFASQTSAGEMIVLKVLEVTQDGFPGIKALGASGFFGERIESLFNPGRQTQCKHDGFSRPCYTRIAISRRRQSQGNARSDQIIATRLPLFRLPWGLRPLHACGGVAKGSFSRSRNGIRP